METSRPETPWFPLVYDELRRIARRCLAGQRSGHTLQPTALVHEAYLRLARRDSVELAELRPLLRHGSPDDVANPI
jgi:hypothetical protein